MYTVLTNYKITNYLYEKIELHDSTNIINKRKIFNIKAFLLAKEIGRHDAYLALNPSSEVMIASFLAKYLLLKKTKIIYFDILLQRPTSFIEEIKRLFKIIILKSVDKFLCVHKDISGYEKVYKVKRNKFKYVPFKANNFNMVDKFKTEDHKYVLSCGASHRDYKTFILAMKQLGYPAIILLPSNDIAAFHNTKLIDSVLPENIEIIHHDFNRDTWNKFLANSRLVVVPITQGTIQPAGISVCFEAMALGKPVLVTEGAFSNGILTDEMAKIVPCADPEALAGSIKQLWEDEGLRKQLGDNGRTFALSLGGEDRLVKEMLENVYAVLTG